MIEDRLKEHREPFAWGCQKVQAEVLLQRLQFCWLATLAEWIIVSLCAWQEIDSWFSHFRLLLTFGCIGRAGLRSIEVPPFRFAATCCDSGIRYSVISKGKNRNGFHVLNSSLLVSAFHFDRSHLCGETFRTTAYNLPALDSSACWHKGQPFVFRFNSLHGCR